jgi:hypothetical protein
MHIFFYGWAVVIYLLAFIGLCRVVSWAASKLGPKK